MLSVKRYSFKILIWCIIHFFNFYNRLRLTLCPRAKSGVNTNDFISDNRVHIWKLLTKSYKMVKKWEIVTIMQNGFSRWNDWICLLVDPGAINGTTNVNFTVSSSTGGFTAVTTETRPLKSIAGWLIVQQRVSGEFLFERTWNDYVNGLFFHLPAFIDGHAWNVQTLPGRTWCSPGVSLTDFCQLTSTHILQNLKRKFSWHELWHATFSWRCLWIWSL